MRSTRGSTGVTPPASVATGDPTSASRGLRRVREVVVSAAPVALAFLATQHHALHMLLLTLGLGAVGTSFLSTYPAIRRGMLVLSLVVAAVLVYQATRPGRARALRIAWLLSAATTTVLVGWSVIEFGP